MIRLKLRLALLTLCIFCVGFAGCGRLRGPWRWWGEADRTVSHVLTPNPASVVITDPEFAWSQIVDEVDDYFKIKKEERIRFDEGIITEGIITTYPTPGSTLLEPWKRDSTPGFEKLHSTFHSVRRSCKVRVIPNGATYLVEVQVLKEMEDVLTPENATVGHTIRSNIATGFEQDGPTGEIGRSRWYEIGRDASLEQLILSRIQARLQVGP